MSDDFLSLGKCMYLPKCPRCGLHARITYRVPLTAVELTLQQHYLTIWHLGGNCEFRNMLFHSQHCSIENYSWTHFVLHWVWGSLVQVVFLEEQKWGWWRKVGMGRGDLSDQVEKQRQKSTKAWTNCLQSTDTLATCQGSGVGVTLKGELMEALTFLQKCLCGSSV